MGAVVFAGPGSGPVMPEAAKADAPVAEPVEATAAPAEPKRRTREDIRREQGKA